MTSRSSTILWHLWSSFLFTTFLLSTIVVPVTNANAERPRVYCEFGWSDNAAFNVKGGNQIVNKKVRTKEYNRLVSMGSVRARVSADGGQHCQLNHPENTTIDIRIEKASYRLDSQGIIPSCRDLEAIVECRGSRFIDTDVGHDSLTQGTQTFTNPSIEGHPLDWCLHWGKQCGKPAADAWCNSKMGKADGFAIQWEKAENIGTTYVMGDKTICNKSSCDGFRWIKCGLSFD